MNILSKSLSKNDVIQLALYSERCNLNIPNWPGYAPDSQYDGSIIKTHPDEFYWSVSLESMGGIETNL